MHAAAPASDSERPPPARRKPPPKWPARRKRKPLDPGALMYDMREAALGMGESVETTRRRLVKSRCAVLIGGSWYTSKGLLRRYLGAIAPELIATIEAARAERAEAEE